MANMATGSLMSAEYTEEVMPEVMLTGILGDLPGVMCDDPTSHRETAGPQTLWSHQETICGGPMLTLAAMQPTGVPTMHHLGPPGP